MEKEVLIIDDDESITWVVKKALEPQGYKVTSRPKLSPGLRAVKGGFQLVLLDIVLPDGSGLEGLKEIRSSYPDAVVIMVTAHGKMESTVEAMKEGAYDYIEKPFDIEELKITVEKAFRDMAVREELNSLRSATAEAEEPQVVGKSPKMLKVFKDIGRVASKDITVLVTGESGTGKELVAKAIHYNSKRRGGPFVAINSASIPRDLMEAELFGWEKGAFTGARDKHTGKIEAANGGTLFLDEISELDTNLQAKLLRFMQDKKFSPLGSNRVVEADVRVIGATNKDLKDAVSRGAFREDLYYRFNVVQIKLPPLRERREDISPLAKHFLKDAEKRFETGKKELSKEAKDLLLKYDWPGNVRELENAIRRACVLSNGAVIEKRDLLLEEASSFTIKEFLEDKLKRYLKEMTNLENCNLYETVISEVEKALINIVLNETGGNQLKAAKTLGINRNTLRTKIKEYRIK
ncbi:MAG: sigma-54 dependent transcriptional regulator [Nitrospirae bacterium]|nr:sigma-54 dependent transcriptional regulator [Nitrospirota bacterium]MCL5422921.1 sigma-54 dependent transcriptional regulator [Nitrospirota bacterium]